MEGERAFPLHTLLRPREFSQEEGTCSVLLSPSPSLSSFPFLHYPQLYKENKKKKREENTKKKTRGRVEKKRGRKERRVEKLEVRVKKKE
jgi:hypothetical protein